VPRTISPSSPPYVKEKPPGEAPGIADVGVLVEDEWQRLGIGGALLHEIAGHAKRDGIGMLTAQVLAEQSWILRLLGAYGSCESTASQGVLDVTVKLSSPHAGRTR
jgi:GNAT superfamily N-acetyltransferase